ncbi:MAG: hypothetical protein QOJ52_1445, partial [Acidimicrobiaceae bacterium]|nr:hypothetical protein [Acidimicrobiaceae bacterium]
PESRFARLMGRYWVPWLQPQHQQFVPVANLCTALEAQGFSVVEVERGLVEHLPGVGPEGVTPVASVGVLELCGRSMVVQRSNSPTKPQIAHRLRAEAAVLGPPRPPAGAGRAGEHSPGPAHCRPRQLPGRAGRPRRPHPMGHGNQRRHRLGEETPHGGRVDRSQRHEHVAPGRIEPPHGNSGPTARAPSDGPTKR